MHDECLNLVSRGDCEANVGYWPLLLLLLPLLLVSLLRARRSIRTDGWEAVGGWPASVGVAWRSSYEKETNGGDDE